MAQQPDSTTGGGVNRPIVLALVLIVTVGAVIAILGETVFHNETLIRLGAGIALVAGAGYAICRWRGKRPESGGGRSS